ncbi:hypothetical protein [Bacillus sp. REN3]|uniref:hypothetical protein n=1 Tax=Bacillus sp. REN3 TaxID=2802440 RepID=UPI001AEE2ACE|nr:hypothetical protein [Bacillus sp. REN3]
MEEILKSIDHFVFTTSTADVTAPNDFVVEFFAQSETDRKPSVIKINNLDELVDFLEDSDGN